MVKPKYPDIWRIDLTVLLPDVEIFETVLEDFTDTVSWFLADPEADETDERTLWRLEGYSRRPIDHTALEAAVILAAVSRGIDVPEITIEQVPDIDWVLATLKNFPPIHAGRFFMHGSHFQGRPPAGRVSLQIDAGTAFGSGEHATTQGCLLAIDALLRRRRFHRPLDLGCGSGILGLAIAKAIPVTVWAADIDPISVHVANRNAHRNGVRSRFRVAVSDGYHSRFIAKHKRYDLIAANILARPLTHMAGDLVRHLSRDGVAVLSGLLTRQERTVLAPHRGLGLSLIGRIRINGWSTLILSRSRRYLGSGLLRH